MMRRTALVYGAIAAASVVTLVACSSSGGSSGSGSGGASGGSGGGSSSSASSGGSGGGSSSASSVLICNVEDLSGSQGVLGVSENQGAQVAIDEINAAGGIKSLNGAKLTYKNFDTQTSTDQGSVQATKAVGAGCKAIWGGEITDTVIPATAITNRANIPFMDIGGTGTEVTSRGFNTVFQFISSGALAQNYNNIINFAAQHFHLSQPTLGVSVSDTSYGQEFYTAWSKINKAKIISNVSYPMTQTDLSSVADRMNQGSPDILVNLGYPPDGVSLGRVFKETLKTKAKAFISTAQNTVALSQLKSEANGQLFEATTPPTLTPTVKKFNADYQAKFHTAPAIEAWDGYEAVMFIDLGLEKAGTTDGKALSAAIHQVTLTPQNGGLYPESISFDSTGAPVGLTEYWQQDQNGKLVNVYPANVKQGTLQPYNG